MRECERKISLCVYVCVRVYDVCEYVCVCGCLASSSSNSAAEAEMSVLHSRATEHRLRGEMLVAPVKGWREGGRRGGQA